MVQLVAVTNTAVAAKFELSVDDETTVGDVRAVVAATLGFDDLEAVTIRLTLRGVQLADDGQVLSRSVRALVDGEKLFVFVKEASAAGAEAGTGGALLRHQALNAKREEDAQRQHAKMMEPMIASLAANPQILQGMLQSQPELQQLLRNNPDAAKELSNPETLKALMMSQLDPDARRRMYTSMEMQLAQVNAMPGGAAAIERAMNSVTRDLDGPGRRTRADLSEISDERARPDPTKSANTEPLPNPWAARPLQGPTAVGPSVASGVHPLVTGLPPWMATTAPSPAALPAPVTSSKNTQSDADQAANRSRRSEEGNPGAAAAADEDAKYQHQLRVLVDDMGFEDAELCKEALRHAKGDIDGAVEFIASRMP
jgi:hypothetical protein